MADIKTAVVRYTLPQVTGNFTVSIPSATWTPKAVMAFVSDNTGTQAQMAVGFCDGTNQRAMSVAAQDNRGTMQANRISVNNLFLNISALDVDAVGTGLGPGGGQWVFNVPDEGTTFNREAIFVFFGGSDLQANVGTFTPNSSQNGAATQTVGFDPSLVVFSSVGLSSSGSLNSTHALLTLGAVYNNSGTPSQAMAAYSNRDGVAISQTSSAIYNNRVAGQVFSDSLSWSGEITSFPFNGFTMTTRDGGTGNDAVYYLALDVGGGDAGVKTWTWPDSTEVSVDFSITGVGFEPSVGVLVTPLVYDTSSFNTVIADDATLSVSAFDADGRSATVAMSSEDAVTTSNENSLESTKPVYTVSGTNSALVTADSFSFNTDGVTFPASGLASNSSTGTYAWGFFVGDGSAAPSTSVPIYLYHHRHRNRAA